MVSFFKTFGQGILYVVLLPFFLLIWALYAIYCLIMFLYMAIRNIIIFCAGGKPLGDMKEDVEAKRILLLKKEKEQAIENMLLRENQAVVQPVIPQEEAPAYVPQSDSFDLNEEIVDENQIEDMEDKGEIDDVNVD